MSFLKSNKTLKIVISILFPLVVIISVPLFLQAFHCNGGENPFWWYLHFKGSYYCNVLVVLFLYLLCYLTFNSTYTATIGILGISIILGLIDSQKMRILNQPLIPGDFLFIRQSLVIAKLYVLPVAGVLILFALMLFILYRAKKNMYQFSLPVTVRIVVAIAFVTGTTLIVKNHKKVIKSLNRYYGINNEYWNQLGNYHKNGVLYTFLLNIASLNIDKPRQYNRENVESIFNQWAKPDTTSTKKQMLPDVIVVLSESFWDITQISPVKLPCDPIRNVRKASKKFPSTRLISPSFGGNTCNAEFEVLTGLSHNYFPPGVMAYNQFITRPVPSLVRVFKENGYRTTGVHTFKQWFWNRTNVYRHFGFDSFISQETMENPEYKGFYISDRELAKQIISTASAKGQPDFIFAISMQNHGPYDLKRYDTLDHQVSTGLGGEADREFNNYFQGLIDADKSFKMLTRYVDTTKTPTLLVFFGDHLPGFSHLYEKVGCKERISKDTLWSHTTSSAWYANYPLKQLPDTMISMFFLPLFITMQTGVSTPVYYKFLNALRETQPLFKLYNEDLVVATNETATTCDSLSQSCRLCVYDVLFGKQYASRFYKLNSAVQ